MDKLLKVALLLTAVDRMSTVVGTASNNSIASLNRVTEASLKIGEGLMMMGAAKKGFDFLGDVIDDFAEMQEKGAYLQATMMKPGGVLDENTYKRLYHFAQEMSDKYSGSTADYLDMMRVLKNNRIDEEDILGGIGEAIEKFSVLFQMKPAAMGEFAAHMKNDMAVAAKDMEQVMDLTMRSFESGVGKTGEEAVYHLNQFFSKVGLGLANLRVGGIEASKEMAVLGNMFITRGISGESVGTNFRRILDGLRDPERIKDANKMLKEYGRAPFEFYDQQGNFKGVANFVAEIGKLQNLDPQKIAQVLKPFSGRQGLSTDFMELLATHGVSEYNTMAQKMFEGHASLDQQYHTVSKTMNMSKAIFQSTWQNTKASFGALLEPTLTKFYQLANKAAVALRYFVEAHPGLTKFALGTIAVGSALLGTMGAIRLFIGTVRLIGLLTGATNFLRWLRVSILLVRTGALGTIPWLVRLRASIFSLSSTAATSALAAVRRGILWLRVSALLALPSLKAMIASTWAWTTALLANPITWIILGIVALSAAIFLVVKNWDKVSAWFKQLWANMKKWMGQFISFALDFFFRFTPLGIIIKNWGKIVEWFGGLWTRVKQSFFKFVAFTLTLGAAFFKAGKNIAMSIGKGIMEFAMYPIEKMKQMVQKIRNLLPFSPAKEGPLRDIHRIRLVETIADGMTDRPIVDKMSRILRTGIMMRPPEMLAGIRMNGGGVAPVSISLHYNPVIHAPANMDAGSKEWLMNVLSKNKTELVDLIQRELSRRERKQYN